MNVMVVGGGRMGLPLACLLAEHGADVTVCDVHPGVVAAINAGDAPYEEPGLQDYLGRNHAAGRLRASTDTTGTAAHADIAVVIVPAHLTAERDIDYGILKSAAGDVARGMRRGMLICFETTVAVGGVRGVLTPVLEQESGLKAGVDFQVGFSPERVKANLVFERLQSTPKIVGGFDAASARAAEAFYARYLGAPVINVETLEAAEFAKLADMLYRDVNIALVNELAAYSEAAGVDFEAVRQAANTSGESALLTPGIGVGGHCTPVYPYFIIQDGLRRGVPQQLAAAARAINDAQPARQAARLERLWGSLEGKRVHILGLAFRPDVKVDIFSTAYGLQEALRSRGAAVTIEDPFFTDAELRDKGFAPGSLGPESAQAVVLNTAHAAYRMPDFAQWRAWGIEAVVDGRNLWPRGEVEGAGLRYLGVGQGDSCA